MTLKDFEKIFDNSIKNFDKINVEDLKIWFDKKLEELVNSGQIQFKENKYLGGIALELKIRNTLDKVGFNVSKKGEVDCDGILTPNEDFEIKKPIVIEVKSGKSIAPSRSELRQLDDYIFELSGEEKARKEGLGRSGLYHDPLKDLFGSDLTRGKKYFHPTPHKGLMIFNNTEGTHFNNKFIFELGYNEIEFAKKRDICVVSFKYLLDKVEQIENDKLTLNELWNLLHKSAGVLK